MDGVPSHPTDKFGEINTLVTNTLFTTFPSVAAATGVKYLSVVKNITGGTRPVFDLGIAFDGIKPTGDDVMTPATVAASTYGCTCSRNTLGSDESGTTRSLRPPTTTNSVPCLDAVLLTSGAPAAFRSIRRRRRPRAP